MQKLDYRYFHTTDNSRERDDLFGAGNKERSSIIMTTSLASRHCSTIALLSHRTIRRFSGGSSYHNNPHDLSQRIPSHRFSTLTSSPPFLRIQDSVQKALSNNQPVVALESTIVAHGMPYPQNFNLAMEVEGIAREQGVTPATIAIYNGQCCIGLSPEELQDLALAGQEGRAFKCSTRDLPIFLANDKSQQRNSAGWGATTVASTMRLAHLAGISTFVTGGIGGVHRQGEITMDVSADLIELSRTPVIVVSAGIKSILDIARTLEVLETYSVPTLSWQSNDFPAFFSPTSGVASPARVDTAEQVADIYRISQQLELPQGMLVAVPNRDPANGEIVEAAIEQALAEAERLHIRGKDVTPYLLKEVAENTHGESLQSNMALVRQNARVGAAIAKAIIAKSIPIQQS
jgi:pseudouridine-5'-phosphate glycosidase